MDSRIADLVAEVTRLGGELDFADRSLDAAAKSEAAIRTCCGEQHLVIEQQDRDLERMRSALREAINWIADRSSDDSTLVDWLSKLLPSTGEPCTTTK